MGSNTTVITMAGRRIDAEGAAVSRFPLAARKTVEQRIRQLLARHPAASGFVSSAACGSDLIGLTVAGELGLDRHIVLPFTPDRFRTESVTDRPGDWGPVYDAMLESVGPDGIEVIEAGDGTDAFLATNETILERARQLAGDPTRVLAVIAWDGAPRGHDDITDAFRRSAAAADMQVAEVLTLPG